MLLHDELYARGLRILAFPCNQAHEQTLGDANNTKHISSTHTGRSERTIPRAPLTHTRCLQFGRQERGSPKEIRAFADGYGARFDIYAKVNVNGRSADPVFTYLKRHLSDGLGSSIKWNFTKFLVDRDGKPRRRFSPSTSPLALRADIERLLDASSAAQDAE